MGSAVAAGMLSVSSFGCARRAAAQEATSESIADDSGSSGIALDQLGGDAWTWEKILTGMCPGCPPEASLELRVNGATFAAERTGDTFSAAVRLAPGENRVMAAAVLPDGTEMMSAPVTYAVRVEPRPTARLVAKIDGDQVIFDGTASEPSEYDPAEIVRWSIASRDNGDVSLAFVEMAPGRWSVGLPTDDGEYYARITVEDEQGRADEAVTYFVVAAGKVARTGSGSRTAGWMADTVVYGVVPRFYDPPNLSGVTARLNDLADLGVTALWFSPLTRTLPGDFGYAVTNYFDIRPDTAQRMISSDSRGRSRARHARADGFRAEPHLV